MASVVVCPHCYLQLTVPDAIESDALVKCPACREQFALSQAEPRSLPEVERVAVPDHLSTTSNVVPIRERQLRERAAQAARTQDAELKPTAEFSTWRTISRVEPLGRGGHSATGDAGAEPVPADPPSAAAEKDEVQRASAADQAAIPDRAAGKITSSKNSAVTVTDLKAAAADSGDEQGDASATVAHKPAGPARPELRIPQKSIVGPTFELPNMPLSKSTAATIDLGSSSPSGPAASSDFELDDVEIAAAAELSAEKTVSEATDKTVAFGESPPTLSNAKTVPDAADWNKLVPSLPESPGARADSSGGDTAAAGNTTPASNPWGELPDPEDVAADQAAAAMIIPTAARRRKPSVLRMLVGCVLFGFSCLALGYYVLLYFWGPAGDVLGVANYLPDSMLPNSFRATPAEVARATDSTTTTSSMPPTSVDTQPAPRPDDAVTDRDTADESPNLPAGYEQPIELPAEPLDERPPGRLDEAADTPPIAAESRYGANRVDREKPPAGAYDAEPARFEAPAAETLPADTPQVIGGPVYSTDQLAAALEAAQAAQPSLVAGDLGDKAVRQIKGRSYAALCELAEALTFCDDTSTPRFDRLEREAEELFRSTFSDAHTRREVARIAAIWIDSPNRQHGGVFVAGSTSGGEIVGDVYEYPLQPGDGMVLSILSPRPLEGPNDGVTTRLGIVGSVVDRPADSIAGYTGDTPQAIWVGRAIPLD
jgi:hypothetical protein